jgi:hypothetical protein
MSRFRRDEARLLISPRRLLRLGAVLWLTAGLATPLAARNEEGDWELGIHRGRAHFSEEARLDSRNMWGGGIGYCFTDIFELAVNLDRLESESDDGFTSGDLDFLTLDFIFNVGEDAHRPYLLFALGTLRQELRGSILGVPFVREETFGLLDLGVGYRGYFNRTVGIRLDARLFFTDDEAGGFGVSENDQRWWVGLVVNLGR